ncbi:MAG: translation initiation factor IF-6 [Candidatus Methanomethylophilaceae archaeon]|nr:translation initiation factor IF-6 [Candidatus Methanomethylophilaceae archaeon]
MRLSRYGGNPNIGVFAVANESLALVAANATPEFIKDVEEALEVRTAVTTVSGSFVVGSLVAMNSNGAVVTGMIEDSEFERISALIPCMRLSEPSNAAGNNILVNDSGAIVNPEFSDSTVRELEDFLGVECVRSSIGDCVTVGSVCRATNKGCICYMDASDEEVALIADVLHVEPYKTTVNHGSRVVGAGTVANSKGALVGDITTPIEMGKVEEGLALY